MQKRWVFGLSVDDELACGLAQVNPSRGRLSDRRYSNVTLLKLADLSNGDQSSRKVPLRDLIRLGLTKARLLPEFKEHWQSVEAVGVSAIGIIDRQNLRLADIRRKPWTWDEPGRYVLDFRRIVEEFFPGVFEGVRAPAIAVHNDATAKCMAYCYRIGQMDEVICLVMAGVGVNVGVASLRAGPPFSPDLHTEMGHAYPRLHPLDERISSIRKHKDNPGCPTHVFCFEGVASAHRMNTFWPKPFAELSGNARREAKEVISYYLAQLCWSATLAVAPSCILISRSDLNEEILPSIRKDFMRLNSGDGRDRPYITDNVYKALGNNAEDFIRLAPEFSEMQSDGLKDPSGLMGAFELGRWAFMHRRGILGVA